jgi:hypothetical protein
VPGGLKAAPTAPFGQPLSERTPELPTAPLPDLASPLAPRPDRRCPTPRARPGRSHRRRVRAVDAAVYTAAPLAAGHRRAAVPRHRPHFGEPRHVFPCRLPTELGHACCAGRGRVGLRPHGRGPRTRCATGPSAVSAQ